MEQTYSCSEKQRTMAESVGICFPTILPLFKSPPNKREVEGWVSAHEKLHPKLGRLARIYVDNINYISFEEFLAELKVVMSDFNKKSQGQPYVLWIPKQTIPSGGCSDLWVAGLALEHAGLRWPENILKTKSVVDYLLAHPEIKTVLALDDCLYSGNHIGEELSWLWLNFNQSSEWKKRTETLRLYLGIPFQTKKGKSKFEHYIPLFSKLNVILLQLPYHHIYTIGEMLDKDMQDFAKKMRLLASVERTLTYFDHVMPDRLSTDPVLQEAGEYLADKFQLLWLIEGRTKVGCASHPHYDFLREVCSDVTEVSESEWELLEKKVFNTGHRLIPAIIRPYRLSEQSSQEGLREALKAEIVGEYSGVAIPKRYSDIPNMLSVHIKKHADNQRKQEIKYGCCFSFFRQIRRIVQDLSPIEITRSEKIKNL